jgi:hypothetical protein
MPATERDGTPLTATGVPLRDLLAACAAARAVSTPPAHEERPAVRADVRRGVAGAQRGAVAAVAGESAGERREAA